MSQPPSSPYPGPQVPQYPYGYDPYGQMGGVDVLAPARRAGIMLFIVGGLLCLLGACNGISGLMLDAQQLAESNQQFMPAGQASPIPPETMRILAIVFAAGTFLIGILLVGLGIPVRGGNRPATITALILASLITLVVGGFVLISLLAAIVSPLMLAFTCVTLVPLVLFGLLVMWLIQALRAAGPDVQARLQQQQAAYWQYAQQQQAYHQSMYAYQQQQQQAAPPPVPQPPDQSADQR